MRDKDNEETGGRQVARRPWRGTYGCSAVIMLLMCVALLTIAATVILLGAAP